MRIGLDLGGTKIEAIALDEDGTAARPAARGDAAPGLRRDAPRDGRPRPRPRGGDRPARHRGRRDAGRPLPRHRPREERELHLAHRPAARPRPRRPPRAAGPPRERRELLRALRGGGRRRGGGARRLRRDRGDGHGRRRSSSSAGCSRGRTRSPASGATTRCRGRARTSGRGRPATAGRRAASRRSCRGPGWPATTVEATGEELDAPEIAARADRGDARGDRHAGPLRGAHGPRARRRPRRPRPRRDRARRRHVADRPALRERAAALAGVGLLRPRRHRPGPPVHGDSSGVRGAAWLWGRERLVPACSLDAEAIARTIGLLASGRRPLPAGLCGLPRARRSPTAPPRRAPGSPSDPALRVGTWLLVLLLLAGLGVTFAGCGSRRQPPESLTELVQATRVRGSDDLVFAAPSVFFAASRWRRASKRRRAPSRPSTSCASIAARDRHASAHEGPGVGARPAASETGVLPRRAR